MMNEVNWDEETTFTGAAGLPTLQAPDHCLILEKWGCVDDREYWRNGGALRRAYQKGEGVS
jgi:hypothetical protein